MTPQLPAIFGLGEGATAGSATDMMANVHADDLARYLADRKAASDIGRMSKTVVRVLRPNGDILRHMKVTVGTEPHSGGREFGIVQDLTEAVSTSERGGRREALLQVTGRARHDSRLRQPGRRASGRGRNPERLHRARNATCAARRIGLSKGRNTLTFRGFTQQSPLPLTVR